MRVPFHVRVESDDPATAREIARALDGPLREYDALARVSTAARGSPGADVVVGVDCSDGTRWLKPLDVPSEPEAARQTLIAFLENWGFISFARRARAVGRA